MGATFYGILYRLESGSLCRLVLVALLTWASPLALAGASQTVEGDEEAAQEPDTGEDGDSLGERGDADEGERRNGERNGWNNGRVMRAIEDLEQELDEAWDWLETRRNDVSRNVTTAGRYLDDWLAGDVVGERSNQSYLRLKLNQRVGRNNAYHSTVRVGGRVDLPRASERWKLIFESESAERESLRNQRLENIYPSSFTGGFRYELDERGGWSFSHDIGLRARVPLDPFYRFRSRYGTELNEDWHAGLRHRIMYYRSDGWRQDARVFFGRELTDNIQLRVTSEFHYRHVGREIEMSQNAALHQSLGELETLTYEVGVMGRNRPNSHVDNYYAQVLYRKAIYDDWLVMELVPQLLSEKKTNWKVDPRVQFNLEVYFFDF